MLFISVQDDSSSSAMGEAMGIGMNSETKNLGLVFIATFFTGTMCIFVEHLGDHGYGMNSFEITFVKFFVSALILFVFLYFTNKDDLRLTQWKDLLYMFFFGLFNVGFTVAIFYSMQSIGNATSCALQATNAYFILVLAAIFFREKITFRKFFAICVGFFGCLFVINIFSASPERLDAVGIALALFSAFGVAVFWMGGKFLGTKGYGPVPTMFWFCVTSSIIAAILPMTSMGHIGDVLYCHPDAILFVIGAAVIPTLIPKCLILKAFQCVDAGKASVVLAFDMVTTAMYSAMFGFENITMSCAFGIILIIVSIAIIELRWFDQFFADKSHGDPE